MLSTVLAHVGLPPEPHDIWGMWNADPVLLAGIALAVWAYARGRTPGRRSARDMRRTRCFFGALLAVGLALISPLEAMSGALASAHMVQHLLLTVVAAPLFALSAPSSAMLRGSPLVLRRAGARWRRLGIARGIPRVLRHPVTVWLLHVATLWLWHAGALYDAALRNQVLHVLQHLTFLATAVLFWRVVLGARGAGRVSPGLGVLLVFGMAMQGVFLSVLLTFAGQHWYAGYATTTVPWGLQPLADQQLAGVIMWVPAGFVYLAAALLLLRYWLSDVDPAEVSPSGGSPARTAVPPMPR